MGTVIVTSLIGKKWKGFALYPFIFAKTKEIANDPVFLNHERIHLAQQKELGLFNFGIKYLKELIKHGYQENHFELEAYHHQHNLEYLTTREPFGYLKF